jgi:hypothetical protein
VVDFKGYFSGQHLNQSCSVNYIDKELYGKPYTLKKTLRQSAIPAMHLSARGKDLSSCTKPHK